MSVVRQGFLCLLLSVLLIAGTPAQRTDAPLRYAALGDSIAYGYGLSSPGAESYVSLVGAGVGAARTVNLAENGKTSAELLAELAEAGSAGAGNALYDGLAGADLVTVSIGANDVLRPLLRLVAQGLSCDADSIPQALAALRGEPSDYACALLRLSALLQSDTTMAEGTEAFASNLSGIVARIRALAPDARIYITNLYNPYAGLRFGAFDLDGFARAYVEKLNAAIGAAAENGGFVTVDIAAAFAASGERVVNAGPVASGAGAVGAGSFSLDPHPNAAGHALIARLITARFTADRAA